jgi:hypothetical protein
MLPLEVARNPTPAPARLKLAATRLEGGWLPRSCGVRDTLIMLHHSRRARLCERLLEAFDVEYFP